MTANQHLWFHYVILTVSWNLLLVGFLPQLLQTASSLTLQSHGTKTSLFISLLMRMQKQIFCTPFKCFIMMQTKNTRATCCTNRNSRVELKIESGKMHHFAFPILKKVSRWCISVIFAKCNRMTSESKSKEEKKMLKYCEDSLEHVEKREPRQGSDDRLGILMIRPLGVWQQKSHSNKVLWALQKHWKNDDGDKI